MDVIEARQMMAEVRANLALLNDCTDHKFEPILKQVPPGECPPRTPLGTKYQCERCGGKVDAIAAHWYARGRTHEATSPSKAPL